MLRARVPLDRVVDEINQAKDDIVDFAAELIRIPTVNPPGACYRDCAEAIGRRLAASGFAVDYVEATGRPEHTSTTPRVNVIGTLPGRNRRPLVHLNGHLDVVPPGEGWTVDPFEGVVRNGHLYGRGSADMKAGIAAAVGAVEALVRAGVDRRGTIEISGTADEESGGWAGMAHLARLGRLSVERTDYVIIPEPLNVDRICIGHRGVYWFKLVTRGRTGHGSMPFLGTNAIELMGSILERMRTELAPAIARRETAMPVAPPEARRGSINVNSVVGGQAGEPTQTPCIPDRCEVVVDRRFLVEEGFEETKREIIRLVDRVVAEVGGGYDLSDLLVVPPTETPGDAHLVRTLSDAVRRVLGHPAQLVASPGTYDHKHVRWIAGIEQCVAYGPGVLEQAHQPDEWCSVDDLLRATKVLALTVADLIA